MNSTFFLVLRRMRVPIIVLIVIYAISIFGLTLVPGVDAEGKAAPPLSFFHAFYFISYTATTIGFGEIPVAFSDAQRLWVTFCIYLTVIGWSYSVVTLIALLQGKGFQNTLTTSRFARRVRLTSQDFYLICGCGETGSLIARSFDHIGQAFVVIEKEELRVEELDLLDFKTDIPALAADARLPDNLRLAGLNHPRCRGVLAVTNDEQSNLAIAIAARLLNPGISVIARAEQATITANMASFGTDHIVNPYERFAERLALAIAVPERFRLIELLTSLPETPLSEAPRPPRGHWILCGYGSFGHAVANRLRDTGITLTIIDPGSQDADHDIPGDGTEADTLRQAGIDRASGIVAGSDNDINNLSIAVTAAGLNPQLFVVARQNHAANSALFAAYDADFTVLPSRIIAQECIAILTAPLLAHFLDLVQQIDEDRCRHLVECLQAECAGLTPVVWDNRLNAAEAPALWRALMHEQRILLGDILRDGADRGLRLPVVPLLVERENDWFLLPADDFRLQAGDQLLFASPLAAQRNLELTLRNANELDYVLTGQERSGSLLSKLLAAR
ncbi:MAG: NAD-binding protein [Betaproteobacteria bacterium]|nr:NAD-binding protein [Betaproteobacteria bacterium]